MTLQTKMIGTFRFQLQHLLNKPDKVKTNACLRLSIALLLPMALQIIMIGIFSIHLKHLLNNKPE